MKQDELINKLTELEQRITELEADLIIVELAVKSLTKKSKGQNDLPT